MAALGYLGIGDNMSNAQKNAKQGRDLNRNHTELSRNIVKSR